MAFDSSHVLATTALAVARLVLAVGTANPAFALLQVLPLTPTASPALTLLQVLPNPCLWLFCSASVAFFEGRGVRL